MIRPFFILGCPCSGTTLLRNILRTHPYLVSPEETHFYRWSFPYGSQAYIKSVLYNNTLQLNRKIDGISETEMHQIINTSISRKQMTNKYMRLFMKRKGGTSVETWFEKTPQNIYGISMLAKDFPGARFIVLVRNPLNVVASLRKGEVMKEKNLKGAINYWNESQSITDFASQRMRKRMYIVKYEDLSANPKEELTKMGDFLGVDFSLLAYDLEEIYPEQNNFLDILGPQEINFVVKHCAIHSKIYNYNQSEEEYTLPKVETKQEKLTLIDKWLSSTEQWNMDYISLEDKNYLDVVCNVSAKSGSTSLHEGFIELNKSSLHIHGTRHLLEGVWKRKNPPFQDFSYFDYLDYLKENNPEQKTLIVDVVREPISRKIAAFFQNLIISKDRIIQISKNIALPMNFNQFIEYFLENTSELVAIFNKHYLLKLEQYYSFYEWEKVGVNVLDQQMDDQSKTWFQVKDWRQFLILRFDEIKDWSKTIQDLGFENYSLPQKNNANEKIYGQLYNQFKSEYQIPMTYLNLIYDFSYKDVLNHFYTKEEQDQLKQKFKTYSDSKIQKVVNDFDSQDYLNNFDLSDKYKTDEGALFHYLCYSSKAHSLLMKED